MASAFLRTRRDLRDIMVRGFFHRHDEIRDHAEPAGASFRVRRYLDRRNRLQSGAGESAEEEGGVLVEGGVERNVARCAFFVEFQVGRFQVAGSNLQRET